MIDLMMKNYLTCWLFARLIPSVSAQYFFLYVAFKVIVQRPKFVFSLVLKMRIYRYKPNLNAVNEYSIIMKIQDRTKFWSERRKSKKFRYPEDIL